MDEALEPARPLELLVADCLGNAGSGKLLAVPNVKVGNAGLADRGGD
jgi:hypothetical protein